MKLELHQSNLRYGRLRSRAPVRETRLIASMADHGQQTPSVGVADEGERLVDIDGRKRVRALKGAQVDSLQATRCESTQSEAPRPERLMCSGDGDAPLEQTWHLEEPRDRSSLLQEELTRRFLNPSWVGPRPGLTVARVARARRETPLKQWFPQIDPPQIRSHERDPRRAGSREPLCHPRLEPEQLLEPAEADGVRIRKAGPSACPRIAHLEFCERTTAPRRRMIKER